MAQPNPAPALAEMLVSVPPRERSGARSSNRFSFQHSWGLGLVLKLHEKPDDYCVLFDVHEDVVALDSPSEPTLLDVFQIKSDTNSAWTVTSLVKRDKNKETGTEKPSILGKLYTNYLQFPGFVKSMSFVTNAPFSISLADKTPCTERESFCLSEIESSDQATINAKISAEHGVPTPPAGLATTYLVRTSLSVLDHETHTEGIVSAFLKTQGDGTIPPAPFHRTLRSELRRRNDKEIAATSFAELAKLRGLSRADMQRMIDSVPSAQQMNQLLAVIREQLVKEAFNVRKQGVLNADVRNYLTKRLDETNTILKDARRRAIQEVAKLSDDCFSSGTPIADVIDLVGAVVANEFTRIRELYSESFLQAIIAVAIYEQHELPPTGQKPTEEKA